MNTLNSGWLRLWRKIATKRIWLETDPKEKTIMITLLLMVNYEPSEGTWKDKTITLKPGSTIVTLEDIAYMAKGGISIDDVADAIDKFSGPLEFLKQKISKDSPCKHLITIRMWKQYQQDGLSSVESEELKDNALKLYKFYIEKISPFYKSKARAISNIIKQSKRHSFIDMSKAVNNYVPKAMSYEAQHRKDPANFFGIREPYFKDYLPGIFKHKQPILCQNQSVPKELTDERLNELNA